MLSMLDAGGYDVMDFYKVKKRQLFEMKCS